MTTATEAEPTHLGHPEIVARELWLGGPTGESVVCSECSRPFDAPCIPGEYVQDGHGSWLRVATDSASFDREMDTITRAALESTP